MHVQVGKPQGEVRKRGVEMYCIRKTNITHALSIALRDGSMIKCCTDGDSNPGSSCCQFDVLS